jgi:sugar-specific transcriptional regulator TrmB
MTTHGHTDDAVRRTLEENIGLSSYEAEVYLALVRGGKLSMKDIADSSGVPKQRVYDITKDLRKRGFVEIIDEYPKKACAVDPTEIISPLRNRIASAQEQLEELHQMVEEFEGGVTLFKSEPTIKKYIREVINTAEDSVFVLIPLDVIDEFRDDLASRTENARTNLIISNLRDEHINGDSIDLDRDLSGLADRIRGIKSHEPFIITADREKGLFWTGSARTRMTSEGQGFYITNPELVLLLDRFLSQSLWGLSKPVDEMEHEPAFPAEYIRMRDCLADLEQATSNTPVEAFDIEFEGIDTTTRENVTRRGTLDGYYFSEHDMRAYFHLARDTGTDGDTVSVGGWKASLEDYEARKITVYENQDWGNATLDADTRSYLDACRTSLPETVGGESLAFGFDGFIDHIREGVDERSGPRSYESIGELGSFGDRISTSAAAGSSCTVEWVQNGTWIGGHTSHVGRAFMRLGFDPTLLGTFGQPPEEPFLSEFDEDSLVSVGQPTYTDAVEFNDGKLLLTDTGTQATLDWELIRDRVGLEQLAERVDGTRLFGVGYWAMIPSMPSIWDGLRTDLWPMLDDPPECVLLDTADIRQLSTAQLEDGIESLRQLSESIPVLMSANRAETNRIADLISQTASDRSLTSAARIVREETGVDGFASHGADEAVLATPGDVVRARAPRCDNPTSTTGAGDHFNTGLALGWLEDMNDGATLVLAHAVAGYFVRNGQPPTYDELCSFVSTYDQHFDTE